VILDFCLQHQVDVIFVDDAGAGGGHMLSKKHQ
jgi:hypothetical protein